MGRFEAPQLITLISRQSLSHEVLSVEKPIAEQNGRKYACKISQ